MSRLARVPAILKRFLQAVLAAACSGRLTADWREEHRCDRCRSVAPSSCACIDGNKPIGRICPNRGWTTVGLVAERVTDGTHLLPPLAASGVPFVLIGNVDKGKIDWNGIRKWVSGGYIQGIDQCVAVRKRAMFFIRRLGPPLVKQWRWLPRKSSSFNVISLTSSRIVLSSIRLFLVHTLNSPRCFDHAKEVARGAAQPTVTLGDLKQFVIPICPLAEQHEIVRRVETLFALAGAIEKRVTAANQRAEKLTQAILAKAFCGELVPTEADLAQRRGPRLRTRLRPAGAASVPSVQPLARKTYRVVER